MVLPARKESQESTSDHKAETYVQYLTPAIEISIFAHKVPHSPSAEA